MSDTENLFRINKDAASRARALSRQAERYRLRGDYEAALADFNRSLGLNPNDAWAMAHRGVVYRALGRYQAALADFERAIELKPDYAWVLVHQANIYMSLRCYEKALADLDRAVALDEAIISHWRGERGLVLNALGRYSETITCCQEAFQADPDDYVARYSLVVAKSCRHGLAHAQIEIQETQAFLRTTLRKTADQAVRAGVLYRLAGLAALQGKRAEALRYLQEAIPLDAEPKGIAPHDPAWQSMQSDPEFQALIADSASVRVG